MAIWTVEIGKGGGERVQAMVKATVQTVGQGGVAGALLESLACPLRLLHQTVLDHFGVKAEEDFPRANELET